MGFAQFIVSSVLLYGAITAIGDRTSVWGFRLLLHTIGVFCFIWVLVNSPEYYGQVCLTQ